MRVRVNVVRSLVLLVAGILGSTPGVAGQSVVGFLGLGRSGFDRLGSPVVAGMELKSFNVAGAYLRFGIRGAWDGVTTDGTTCEKPWPVFEGCQEEAIRTDVRLASLWLGLGYEVVAGANSFEIGVRRTRHSLSSDVRGLETGRSDHPLIPQDAIERWAVDVGVGRNLGKGLPLAVKLMYSYDPTDFHGCATDVATPFCGGRTIHVFSLGLEMGT